MNDDIIRDICDRYNIIIGFFANLERLNGRARTFRFVCVTQS